MWNARSLSLLLVLAPLAAQAAPPTRRAVVIADREDVASEAAVSWARSRIRAETTFIDEPTEDAAHHARRRGLLSCAGASACMARVLRENDAVLALFLRIDGKSLTVQQVVIDGDKRVDSATQVSTSGSGGILAALDRHLDEHVVSPLGTPEAAARARARLGVVPPGPTPVATPLPVQPKQLPQSPLAPQINRGQPTAQCYGARTDDCPDGF